MAKSTKTTTKKKAKKKPSSVSKTKKATKAFRTYKQALNYLFEKTDYERQRTLRYNVTTFNLDRMNKLLKYVDNPHQKIKTVHIAGTKGKGSTAVMLAKMLEANSYKVGLYTSPHVNSLHERITINGDEITEKEMVSILNRLHGPIEKMKSDSPTFFEIMTALAFLHFMDNEIDIAVIETGLGGRLDSTNVINPNVVGITSISYDHQQQLGNTLDSIAAEKAGVIKKGIPVVTVPQEPQALSVLKKQATSIKAPFSIAGCGGDIDFSSRFEYSREYGPHTRICLTTPTSKFEHLRVPLPGQHQAVNCGLALAMLDKLKETGYEIDDKKAVEGLSLVKLQGRMEMVHADPRIIVDAAHNGASIKALVQAIGQHVPYDSMIVVFGCNQDKDVKGMLTELQYGADKVIFTKSNSPRAMFPEDLAEMYTEICGKMCQTAINLKEALKIANSAVSREDLICVTGSFYLVGQTRQMFLGK